VPWQSLIGCFSWRVWAWEHNEPCWWFSLSIEYQPICIPQHPNGSAHSRPKVQSWPSFVEMSCDAIPCSIVSFLGRNGVTSFHHQSRCWTGSHCPQQHVAEATVMTHPSVSSVFARKQAGNPLGTNFSISQSLYLYGTMFSAKLCWASLTSPFGSLWWARQHSACCVLLWRFSVDNSAADRGGVHVCVLNSWHCWHLCRHLRTHD
jgi:hypothetical protein